MMICPWGNMFCQYETYTPRMEVSRFLEVILGLTRLEQEEGNLYIRPLLGGSNELVPVGEGQFRGPEDPVATTVFIPKEDGGWYGCIPCWFPWLT